MKSYSELVSIVIVTYNSEKYILETLESIKNQTYNNIELIISDDNSIDKTVDIAEEWILKNKKLFNNTVIIKSKINTGVCANLNRGIKISKGKYIKSLAGDDLLEKHAIFEYLSFAKKCGNKVIFSDFEPFTDNEFEGIDLESFKLEKEFFSLDIKRKYEKLIIRNYLVAPTVFIEKCVFEKIGLYDEKFKLLEDWPYWLKLVENNIDFGFINKKLVDYRINNNSISNQRKVLYNEIYYGDLYNFYKYNRREKMKKNRNYIHIIDQDLNFKYIRSVIKNGNKKENISIYNKMFLFLNPFWILRKIKLIIKNKF